MQLYVAIYNSVTKLHSLARTCLKNMALIDLNIRPVALPMAESLSHRHLPFPDSESIDSQGSVSFFLLFFQYYS